ncbi:hypothetical protein [Runella sp.]|jgi:hypothetical protein|uniref:hypothetical protein n=1 Tax=Runella sp. TaxID=1960881 RepID=UPI00262F889C|nr:hypothetical protein [Runella sp.]
MNKINNFFVKYYEDILQIIPNESTYLLTFTNKGYNLFYGQFWIKNTQHQGSSPICKINLEAGCVNRNFAIIYPISPDISEADIDIEYLNSQVNFRKRVSLQELLKGVELCEGIFLITTLAE